MIIRFAEKIIILMGVTFMFFHALVLVSVFYIDELVEAGFDNLAIVGLAIDIILASMWVSHFVWYDKLTFRQLAGTAYLTIVWILLSVFYVLSIMFVVR